MRARLANSFGGGNSRFSCITVSIWSPGSALPAIAISFPPEENHRNETAGSILAERMEFAKLEFERHQATGMLGDLKIYTHRFSHRHSKVVGWQIDCSRLQPFESSRNCPGLALLRTWSNI